MKLLAWVRQALPRPRITIARWIALTTLTAMLFLLLLKGLFSLLLSVWAQPPLLESGVIEKVAAVTRILDVAPMAQRANIASAAGDGSYSVRWLRRHDEAGVPVLVDAEFSEGTPILRALLKRPDARVEAFAPSDMPEYAPERGYALMIELTDKSWVLFRATNRSWGLDELPRNLIILGLMLVSSLVVALLATRYLAKPLERFAEGARRFGKDFNAPPIPVVGPHDLRQTILAFNATQAQLKHFLNDRTQMLAAISHDLRAPLTRMRLRAEFIDDAQLQAKLFKDVDEMQAMVDAALGFFRDDARLEQTTVFDLGELLLTVVDDFKDAGVEVGLSAGIGFEAFCGHDVLHRAESGAAHLQLGQQEQQQRDRCLGGAAGGDLAYGGGEGLGVAGGLGGQAAQVGDLRHSSAPFVLRWPGRG